jgi:hypothetical protein
LKGSWAGWVLQCNGRCYGVMESGKRSVKMGWLMGVIGFIDVGFGEVEWVLRDLIKGSHIGNFFVQNYINLSLLYTATIELAKKE